jgi:hypothetical protein
MHRWAVGIRVGASFDGHRMQPSSIIVLFCYLHFKFTGIYLVFATEKDHELEGPSQT